MGVLYSGHYGRPPEAESGRLTLQECVQRLNLKPTDFVSAGEPAFFEKSFGTHGRYMLFKVAEEDVLGSPVWKAGYYLLPLDAADVLSALEKRRTGSVRSTGEKLPYEVESPADAPEALVARARQWADSCQPLFFKCRCDHLELRLDPPWGLRRKWKARLRCPGRCQPALTTGL